MNNTQKQLDDICNAHFNSKSSNYVWKTGFPAKSGLYIVEHDNGRGDPICEASYSNGIFRKCVLGCGWKAIKVYRWREV